MTISSPTRSQDVIIRDLLYCAATRIYDHILAEVYRRGSYASKVEVLAPITRRAAESLSTTKAIL